MAGVLLIPWPLATLVAALVTGYLMYSSENIGKYRYGDILYQASINPLRHWFRTFPDTE